MLSAIAYRSLAQAKADHADIKVLAAGDPDAQQKAIQMLKVLKFLTLPLSRGTKTSPEVLTQNPTPQTHKKNKK